MEMVPFPSPFQHSIDLSAKGIPVLFGNAGEAAAYRFIEFFMATIHNPNTRLAYYSAVCRFAYWCEQRRIELPQLNAVLIAKYVHEYNGP